MTTDGFPPMHDYLAGVVEAAATEAKRATAIAGVAQLLHLAEVYDGGATDHQKALAIYDVATKLAYDKTVPIREATTAYDCMPDKNGYLASITDVAETLCEQGMVDRGRPLLQYVADRFEAAYVARDDDEQGSNKPNVTDYVSVAHSQSVYGRPEVAQQTARKVAPHLISSMVFNQSVDPGYIYDNGDATNIIRILGLNAPESCQLFKLLQGDRYKALAVSMLKGNFAKDLLMVGEVDAAIAIDSDSNRGPLDLWEPAGQLWEQGEQDTVQQLITAIDGKFPDYFTKDCDLLINMTNIMPVLLQAGRDDKVIELLNAYKGIDQGIGEMKRCAYQLGLGLQADRFFGLISQLGYSGDELKAITEAYNQGSLDSTP